MSAGVKVGAAGSERPLTSSRRIASARLTRSPADDCDRLEEAKRRLEQELAVDTAANHAYEQFHQSGRDTKGRRMGRQLKPHIAPVLPEGAVNLTDPDSRLIHDKRLTKLQGYNAQAAVSCDGQIIIAAEISARSPDFGQLAPVFDAALRDLASAGVNQRPQTVLADTGYWHSEQTDQIVAAGTQVLIPPQSRTRDTITAGVGHRPLRVHARGAGQSCRQRRSTTSARNRSSRRSGRSNTTAGSDSSDDEAEPPPGRNGG